MRLNHFTVVQYFCLDFSSSLRIALFYTGQHYLVVVLCEQSNIFLKVKWARAEERAGGEGCQAAGHVLAKCKGGGK